MRFRSSTLGRLFASLRRYEAGILRGVFYHLEVINKKGYSFAELITASAIASIVILMVMAIFTTINQRFVTTRERLTAEEIAASGENLLKSVFGQALDLELYTAALPATLPGPGLMVPAFTYGTVAAGPAAWTALAVFNREAQAMSATAPGVITPVQGHPQQTAIWYIGPTATTEGVLVVDTASSGAAAWPVAGVSPSYADPYIERISSLQMTPNVHPTFTSQIVSIDVHFTIRYHENPQTGEAWCPAADMGVTAGCTVKGIWRDVDRVFRIITRNNRLHAWSAPAAIGASSPTSSEERVFGNLFFFNTIMPVK